MGTSEGAWLALHSEPRWSIVETSLPSFSFSRCVSLISLPPLAPCCLLLPSDMRESLTPPTPRSLPPPGLATYLFLCLSTGSRLFLRLLLYTESMLDRSKVCVKIIVPGVLPVAWFGEPSRILLVLNWRLEGFSFILMANLSQWYIRCLTLKYFHCIAFDSVSKEIKSCIMEVASNRDSVTWSTEVEIVSLYQLQLIQIFNSSVERK